MNSPNQTLPTLAFTTHFSGKARVLKNEIHISDAFDPRAGGTAPVRKPYVCIWDTGATNSVITNKVATELGLQPSGRVKVQTVGQGGHVNEYEVNTYVVNIYLPNKVALIGIPVSEGEPGGADALIGMDVITAGDFAITNHVGKTTLTFRVPSMGKIDFVEEVNASNAKTKQLTADQQRKEKNRKKKMRHQHK